MISKNVLWWPHTTNKKVASFRLRCLNIKNFLKREFNYSTSILKYYTPRYIPKVIILSKRYDSYALKNSLNCRKKYNTKIILDLCDNHLYALQPENIFFKNKIEKLRTALMVSDFVVVSSEELASQIKSRIDEKIRIRIIEDAVEEPYTPNFLIKSINIYNELKFLTFKQELLNSGVEQSNRLVWFGNHGSDYADGGMIDLIKVYPSILKLSENIKVSLTIISNNYQKYKDITKDWKIRCHYLDWNISTFSRALYLHSVSIIPINVNPFTSCKTNNRIATSLKHNLVVVADEIPSYKEFNSSVLFSNWHDNIKILIQDEGLRNILIGNGLSILSEKYNIKIISEKWMNIFEEVINLESSLD